MKTRRSALDELLLKAGSTAANHTYAGFRSVGAREAQLLRRPRIEDHGAAKVKASEAVRILMQSLNEFSDPDARVLLADGLKHVVDAIRREPDRPPAPQPEPRRYWMEGDAA